MRKQTKKVLSWVLSAAMVLSVANGASFVTKLQLLLLRKCF